MSERALGCAYARGARQEHADLLNFAHAMRRLRWGHAVWHVFVMIGSLLHFFGVLLYVIPAP